MANRISLPLPVIIYDAALTKQSTGQCDCDCDCGDCACSFPPAGSGCEDIPLFSPLIAESHLSLKSESHTLTLDDDYVVCYGCYNIPAVLNRSALFLLSYFINQPRIPIGIPSAWRRAWGDEVIRSTVKRMVSLGLVVPEGCTTPVPTETSTILSSWLHVTDRCNLRCAYCYLPHAHADMSTDIGRAAIDAIFRSALAHGYRQAKLKYAGGEPLLRFSLITELHRYASRLAEKHGLELDGVVLSNGTLLTAQMVAAMQTLGLRLMISLDGLGGYHDCQRRFADGRGSFDAVAHAVNLALSHSLIPDISITVSRGNIGGLPELLAWILERDLPFSLNFYRENDFSAFEADLQLEEECITKGMLAAYRVIESSLPRRGLLASLADRANLSMPHLRTCGVGHSYLVFDHLGGIAKCQMDMEHTVTDVNDPDPLTSVRESTKGICNLEVDEKDECRDCEWRYWCTGGCPLQTYRVTGRYAAKSPYCNVYRALFPEIVRLEGLRIKHTAEKVSEQ